MRTIHTTFTAAFLVLASLNFSIAEETIQISTGEWTPYISEQLKHSGVVAHIVSEAFALEGIKVKYHFMPWKRAMMEAKVGTYAASIIWSRSEKRQQDFLYSEPVMPKKVVYFHLKSYDFKWSNLDDLKGLKVRASGRMTAKFLEALGAEGVSVSFGEVPGALQKGVVDCAVTGAGSGYSAGWWEVSSHLLPIPLGGWDSVVTAINMDKWNGLSDQNQALIEIGAGESLMYIYAETEYVNPYAMVEMGEKYGVITRRWRDDQIAVFEQAWNDVVAEDSAKDPLFKEVADSYFSFRKDYKKWGDAQSLKATYLD